MQQQFVCEGAAAETAAVVKAVKAGGMGNSSNGQNNSGAEATSNLDTYQYFSKWRFRRFTRPW